MGELAEELSEILEQEYSLLSRISDEARLKTDALKDADIVGIDRIVNREQPLAMQLQAAEQKRQSLLKKNRLERHTLGELIDLVGVAHSQKLRTQLKSMSEMSQELSRTNNLNVELTRIRLEFYNYLLGSSKPVYENNGKIKRESASSSLIDRKA